MLKQIANPANALTLSRFVSAPIVLGLAMMLVDPALTPSRVWVAPVMFALILITVLTDLFDGLVARRLKVVTDFGKIMDPVADSTFFMTLMFALSVTPRFGEWFPIWFPILVLWREVAMHVLRRYAALKQIVLAAKTSGKAKMVIQSVLTIGFTLVVAVSDLKIIPIPEHGLQVGIFVVGIIIVLANWLSMIEYLREIPKLAATDAPPADTP